MGKGSTQLVKICRYFVVSDWFSSGVIGCATRVSRMYDVRMYFHMPFISTLLNTCNANDDVHNRINLPSLMQCVCLIIGNDFTVFISRNLILQIHVN